MADASTQLSVRSESVQRLYDMYLSDKFRVNRRYQRKLVWSVEEKQKLIDSILRDLPIPLFLVAEISDGPGTSYELIDGMQRLNAIFSFIENEFSVNGQYFDLDALADTKLRKDRGQFLQGTPILDRETSVRLANYTMALSVFRVLSDTSVDEVFRRINSGGRRLSKQELRQAGTVSRLADLVRVISSRIRGDTSPSDVLPLKMMPNLSISNRKLSYGVQADGIFWCKQGILRQEDVRTSQDEQLVLDLLIDCLIEPLQRSGSRIRDSYYSFSESDDASTKEAVSIDIAIESYGFERLIDDFMLVYDAIRELIEEQDKTFAQLIGVYLTGRAPRYFHAVFIAMHEIMIRENMVIKDRAEFARRLEGSATKTFSPPSGGDWVDESKRTSFNAVKTLMLDLCEPRSQTEDFGRYGWSSRLETLLGNALIEQQLFDCKQGFFSLNGSRNFDESSFRRICRTLTAMANYGKDAVGYVAIGIADDKEDAEKIAALDGTSTIIYRGFHIVGIQRELSLTRKSLNEFWSWLMHKVRESTLDPRLQNYVSAHSRLIPYKEQVVALITVQAQAEPVFYEGKLLERAGSNTVEVEHSQYMRIYKRF